MSRPVRVAVDFLCPASYLAVAPTLALEAKLGTSFEWLPFPAVASTRPRLATADEDRSARHFRLRAEYLAGDLRRYAESRGIELGTLSRSADTTAAALGLLWLRRCNSALAGQYAARVFDRIWRDNAEPDRDFVESSLASDGHGFRDFAESDGPSEIDAIRERLSSEGVWNVPAYLVGGELFIGRQHLPVVERLAGQ